jgi:hypothetical protein
LTRKCLAGLLVLHPRLVGSGGAAHQQIATCTALTTFGIYGDL